MKRFYTQPQVEVVELALEDSVLNASTIEADSHSISGYSNEDAF